jgi:hypothetical protein
MMLSKLSGKEMPFIFSLSNQSLEIKQNAPAQVEHTRYIFLILPIRSGA